MPKHEKLPMSRLSVTSMEIAFGLPVTSMEIAFGLPVTSMEVQRQSPEISQVLKSVFFSRFGTPDLVL
jgi:hypothetical protein